jgi:pantoate--beta-alanine ligase
MQTVKIKSKTRATTSRWKNEGESVAFVPTMGNLHEGHLKLVDVARQHASKVVVSIYVNPAQFSAGEDIDNYPRTLERDSAMLAERGVDLLFAPDSEEMLVVDSEHATRVEIPGLSTILCGEFRPTHFVGVTSIVAKLFNIVQPDLAVFGEKDFQQLFLIRKMVSDLDFPIKILGVPTVREDDGLAMSSRNGYLDAAQRMQARYLYQSLQDLSSRIERGEKDYAKLEEDAVKYLENYAIVADYVSIRRINDLQPAASEDTELVILAAVKLGKARLIDNIIIHLSGTI